MFLLTMPPNSPAAYFARNSLILRKIIKKSALTVLGSIAILEVVVGNMRDVFMRFIRICCMEQIISKP
jgi:hypothetical protein